MNKPHKSSFTLGILGDGQLARLCAQSAAKNKQHLHIYSLNQNESPCRGLSTLYEGKSWVDEDAIRSFCSDLNVVILENEFIPTYLLEEAESKGIRVVPNVSAYKKIDDKLKQIKIAESLGVNVPKYTVINTAEDLKNVELPGNYDS